MAGRIITVKHRNRIETLRASGLIGTLNARESAAAIGMLSGRGMAQGIADALGLERPGPAEIRDARECMASERVRRAIAGVTQVRGSDVRSFVFEKLVAESEEAREGAVRLQALVKIGELPGVDMWRASDDRDESLAQAGQRLGEALAALDQRLSADIQDVEAVQIEPDAGPDSDALDLSDPFA
jgi:hypothetical protein